MNDYMNKLVVSFVMLVCNIWGYGITECHAKSTVVTSPDGAVTVTVGVEGHKPYYMVSYQDRVLVTPSRLGFLLDNGELGANTKMVTVNRSTKDETWTQPKPHVITTTN